MERRRVGAIDVLRALAIVTVVWIHALPAVALGTRSAWRWAIDIGAHAAVPALFLASGFVTARRPSWARGVLLSRRLPRLVGPYVLASVLAVVVRILVLDDPMRWTLPPFLLVTGAAWEIYYFVPVLIVGTLLLEVGVLPRPRLFVPVTVVLVGVGLLFEARVLPVPLENPSLWFWNLRNPLRWLGHLFLGAVIGARWAGICAWSSLRRSGVVAGLATISAASWSLAFAMPAGCGVVGRLAQGTVMITLPPAVLLLARDHPAGRGTRRLSECAYAIYLHHVFVLAPVAEMLVTTTACLLAGTAALAYSLAVALGARRLLGTRARYVVG